MRGYISVVRYDVLDCEAGVVEEQFELARVTAVWRRNMGIDKQTDGCTMQM